MTNADKIRALPSEDLAEILRRFCACVEDCTNCPMGDGCVGYRTTGDWVDWLESEAEE